MRQQASQHTGAPESRDRAAPEAPRPDARRAEAAPGAAVTLQRASIPRLQAGAGNRAVARMLAQPPVVQRDDGPVTTVPTLDESYRAALASAQRTGDWRRTAELLNGFSRDDILVRLARLSPEDVAYLNHAAETHPRVGPGSQLAQLTRHAAAPRPAPPLVAVKAVPDMTAGEKLLEAYNRANVDAEVRQRIRAAITPEALVLAVMSFAVVFVASQLTPVGWAADIGIALTGIFLGTAIFNVATHLIGFAAARNATTPEQLDEAGREFARAVAEIEIDALLFLVTRSTGAGAARPGRPMSPPPTGGVVLAVGRGQLAVVGAETLPAAVAAQLGGRGAGAIVLLTTGGGRGRPPISREFEPPIRDHAGKAGGEVPATGAERSRALDTWTREEMEFAASELEQSIAARQAEQAALGETSVGAQGQRVGAAHRQRIESEIALLRAINRRLGR